jgi:hypothetical protein
MTGLRNQPTFVVLGKEFFLAFGAFGRMNSVPFPVEKDRRHFDYWLANQLSFDQFQRWVAGRSPVAMSIGMDDDLYKVRVVKTSRGLIIFSVSELPVRTPELP